MLASTAANATCWRTEHVAAAKVRELDSMLMVSALRCRTGANDFMAAYNGFVEKSRVALTQVNVLLRAHFTTSVGKAGSLNAYDNYVTKMANRYGAGVSGLNCRDMGSILAAAMSEGGSVETLSALADRAEMVPVLDDAMCAPVIIAQASAGSGVQTASLPGMTFPATPNVTKAAPRTAGMPPAK